MKVNETLPEAQQIRKFLLLYKQLDADDGELTRTRKVRRGVIKEKYGEIIDAIYAGRDVVHIDTMITFQDGTRSRILTDVRVETVLAADPAGQRQAAEKSGTSRGRSAVNWDLLTQLIVNGLIVGTLYGVVAMCFVLIYKSTQVVNFAQGEFLLIGAWTCWGCWPSSSCPFTSASR